MKTIISKRKRYIVFMSAFILVAAAIFLVINSKTPDTNTSITNDSNVSEKNIQIGKDNVKIFIGSYINNVEIAQEAKDNPELLNGEDASKYIVENIDITEKYKNERKEFITELSKTRGEDVLSSVVLLNKYCTVDDIKEFINQENVNVTCVYLWIPGKTGRIRVVVYNNDINVALTRHFNEFKKRNITDEQMLSDYNRIMSGDFGIFSIVIEAKINKLVELQNSSIIDFIDVMYNPDAENIAAESGKSFNYIEIPSKPDGAL